LDKNKENLIFIRPRRIEKESKPYTKTGRPYPPKGAPHEDDADDLSWRKDGVYVQISKTYEGIKNKEVRDEEFAYYLLETSFDVNHPNSKKVINKLKAKILFHIDLRKNRVLVESPLETLREITENRHLKYIEKNIHLIRPLRVNEKLSETNIDIEWLNRNPNIIIEIIPNINGEKRAEYIQKVLKYVANQGVEIIKSSSDKYLKSKGLITAKASLSQSRTIAENTNLIYRIFKSPKIRKSSSYVNTSIVGRNFTNRSGNLYKVCIVDTGVEDIPQLLSLIENISYENFFTDGKDQDNHGTPISCLVTHGEGFDISKPLFKIISHKIYSENLERGDLFQGLINAIELYEDITKVFVSSCHYLYDNEEERNLTARLNKFIQEKNICVIFCCGNTLPPYDVANYPGYIDSNKVVHPSDAISITSVGSLVKYTNSLSFAPIGGPSPFTRIGCPTNLAKSIKPEVVQHGGNCSYLGNDYGIGVKTFSNLGNRCERSGTSFAAPLFARTIANIYQIYGDKFQNNETARAIAFSSCTKGTSRFSKYLGFGESSMDDSIYTPWNNVRIAFEGNIPLELIRKGQGYDVYDEIRFVVPPGISDIDLTIVHTDDYTRYLSEPKLHSFLSITTWKPGREAPVEPKIIFPGQLSHAKKLSWQYSRGTVGSWAFQIYPKNLDIPKNERSEVTLRYGGLIELTARRGILEPLVELFKSVNSA